MVWCIPEFGAENEVPLSRIFSFFQRRRDDNKNKIFAFEGGGLRGQRGKSPQNACFRGKGHDNKILKVQILFSRNFVVIAQAPILSAVLSVFV